MHDGIHPPPAQCMLGYGQQAGSTHPTGMHSCSKMISLLTKVHPRQTGTDVDILDNTWHCTQCIIKLGPALELLLPHEVPKEPWESLTIDIFVIKGNQSYS